MTFKLIYRSQTYNTKSLINIDQRQTTVIKTRHNNPKPEQNKFEPH